MKYFLLLILLIFPLSCYDGLSDMYDNLGMKVPICVNNATGNDANDGRGWRNAKQTIEAAILAAEDGDEIWIAGDQHLISSITLDKTLAILGGFTGSEDKKEKRNPTNKSEITAGINIRISISGINVVTIDVDAFKFTGFSGLGVFLINNNSIASVNNCYFDGNAVSGAGGAINIDGSSTLKIYDSVFIGNGASGTGGKGGAIYANNSVVTIIRTRFGDKDVPSSGNNSTEGGGAIYATGVSTVNIQDNCEFYRNNTSNGSGGAIYLMNSTLTVSRSSFGEKTDGGNSAYSGGGAIYSAGGSTVNILDNCEFYRNTTSNGSGGAVYAAGLTDLKIENSFFGDETLNSGNTAGTSSGGAIYANNSGCVIRNTVFRKNTALQTGGAIRFSLFAGCSGEVNNCQFLENQSDGSSGTGGAISIDSGIITISNTLFFNNSSNWHGGAIFNGSYNSANSNPTIKIINSTFYNNKADPTDSMVSGGAIYFTGNHSIYNTVFYGNDAGSSGEDREDFCQTMGGFNINRYNCYYDFTKSYASGTVEDCIDSSNLPFLSIDSASPYFLIPKTDLGDFGLFNKGLNTIPGFTMPSTDLAGNPRKVGTIDIGCYEKQ